MRETKKISLIISLSLLLVVISVLGMNVGKMNLNPLEVWQVFKGQGTAQQALIIYEFRLPRIFLAVLVGIGMGVSGSIMQSLLRNDMASPGTLGISSGSGLFVLVYIAIFSPSGISSPLALPILAFIGGLIAALLIFLLAYRPGRQVSPTGLILTGVAVGSGYSALTTLISLKLDQRQMDFMQKWQAGNLWGDEWVFIKILAPWVLILFCYSVYKARVLNTLNLGEETATGLGVAVKAEFIGLALTAVALSSASVALGGNFFFVGMIAPHMARKLVGSNHQYYLPVAALVGAIMLLLADTITRSISFGTDMPTGIVITVLSTPYFLYLLAKAD